MKSLLIALSLLIGSYASAERELKVVENIYSEPITCLVQAIDNGVREPVMQDFMFCEAGYRKAIDKIKSEYVAVLRIEPIDDLAKNLMAGNRSMGNQQQANLKVRVIGTKYPDHQ